MRSRIAVFMALSLTIAAIAAAQAKDAGTIIRLDPQASVVMLEGGRMYRVTPSTAILVDDRPTSFKALRPSERVSIQDGEPVLYRDGRYIALKPAPAPTVAQVPPPVQAPPPAVAQTPPPAHAPPPVVTEAPPSVAVLAPASNDAAIAAEPLTVRRTIYGTVTDVASDGKVKIKTDGDSFEARVSPDALREINRGDNVVIHFSISPPGAASPR
jgi:hypothetical protein